MVKMIKYLASLALAMGLASAFAGSPDDVCIYVKTAGVDTYKDGTPVLDGEVYALVWRPQGVAFAGICADGSLVDPENNTLLAMFPRARQGRLPVCSVQVPALAMATYRTGTFELHVLDTRTADGQAVSGLDKTTRRPIAVNGCNSVATMDVQAAIASCTLGVGAPIRVDMTSAVPADAPQPVITAVRMEKDVLVISVKGTAAYLHYTAAAVTPGDGAAEKAARPVDGAATVEDTIEIRVPAKGNTGLFKVVRD